jgi:hypothetical protein
MGDLATLPTFQAAPTVYTHSDFNAAFAALTIANGAVSTNKLADQAVTFQKMQNVATATLLGRSTAGTGAVESITLGGNLTLAAGVLNLATAINGVTIGATTPGTGTFTTLSATGPLLVSGAVPSHAAARATLSYEGSSASYVQAYGVDAGTQGSLSVRLWSSDGSATTTPAVFSSTGLAVTGALSTTGAYTNTSGAGIAIVLNTTASSGPQISFSNASAGTTPDWRLGTPGVADSKDFFLYDNSAAGRANIWTVTQATGLTTFSYALAVTGLIAAANDITQVGSYHNFTATQGATGYGIRNNGGTMEFKNNGGSWQGIGTGGGGGTVTAIGVTTANGVSGSSSGGATPNLTITLGAITPTSITMSGALSGGTTCDFSTSFKVGGTKVLGAQGAAISDLSLTVSGFTTDIAEHSGNYSAIQGVFNTLLARLRASTGHGLIA